MQKTVALARIVNEPEECGGFDRSLFGKLFCRLRPQRHFVSLAPTPE